MVFLDEILQVGVLLLHLFPLGRQHSVGSGMALLSQCVKLLIDDLLTQVALVDEPENVGTLTVVREERLVTLP